LVSANTALVPGDKLGRFQLLIPIGSGGMGRVWVAREDKTGRLFAIKTTLADEKAAGEFWNVLLDEARIAAQVQHRGVCAIHAFELDEQRGVPYLVMDFSDGGSLFEVLDASPGHRIEAVLAAGITALVCGGLQAAHDLADETGSPLGVVHRDVSPQNILISAAGEVQLTDFGVAKARGRLHAATETGEVKGKLSYMAPEQVTTRNVDSRADVFALGCVLYEATVGERPFHGEDAVATMYQLLEEPLVLPSARFAGYPTALEEIVVKALQRNPADRYQRAEDLGRALSVWIAAQGRIVSEREISTLMRDTLGTKIAERARRITAAEGEIDNPPPQGEQTLTGSSANTQSIARANGTPKSRLKTVLLVAGACGLILLGVVGLRRFSHQDPTPVAANSALKTTPEPLPVSTRDEAPVPPATSVETVSITLRAEPARAVLFLDDSAALPNPYTFSVPRGDAEHRVRASAAGFSERTQPVRFDGSKDVLLTLSALARTQTHSVSAATPGHVDPATTRPGELPTIVKKPPRTLDSDNPFARP
jgi:serine/threonine protein kinase